MKIFAATFIALITAVWVVAAQPSGKAPGKTAEPAKITGTEVTRPGKGFIGLEVVGGNFRLSFYDESREPVSPAAVKAVLRWTPTNRTGSEFYALEPSADGKALTSPKTVRPPYQFKLFLSLFAAGAEAPFESHTIDFRQ
jgi:hypothetical protein